MVMSQLCWLFVPFWGGERPLGGEVGHLGVSCGTPATFIRWKHRVVFHNRGEQWDTPLARWAGEGKDCIKFMMQLKLRREDVIRNLFESKKQAVEKQEPNGTLRAKKARDLLPLEFGIPVAGKLPTLDIKED